MVNVPGNPPFDQQTMCSGLRKSFWLVSERASICRENNQVINWVAGLHLTATALLWSTAFVPLYTLEAVMHVTVAACMMGVPAVLTVCWGSVQS